MIYDKKTKGIVCNRDFYGEHFNSEIKCNYMISVDTECIAENENPKLLAKEIRGYADQLIKWANHFDKMKK
jgi:hypothetical protein